MATEIIDGKQVDKKLKSRNPIIEFDQLQLYFREPYVIDLENVDGTIVLTQPSINDIIRLGEKRFYATLNIFTTNTTAFRLQLWQQGADWNEVSDFDLFIGLLSNADKDVYQTFLPDIDFAKFAKFAKRVSETKTENVLYDIEDKIEINEQVYFHISQCLRTLFNIYPTEKITDDAILKKWYIEKDKRELKIREEKKEKGELDEDSNLMPIISGCVNHPGFKYKTSELKEIGVYEFWDSVKRLQVYESTTALQKGMYSGFMDTKNIKPEDYNFMRVI